MSDEKPFLRYVEVEAKESSRCIIGEGFRSLLSAPILGSAVKLNRFSQISIETRRVRGVCYAPNDSSAIGRCPKKKE